MQECRPSQPANPMDIIDLTNDEIRVCDTCGDAGQEELLALCNKCTDGAEHIYCMRVIRDKVPKGDWTCEECMLRINAEKEVQKKVEEAARISKGHIKCQNSSSSSKLKLGPSSAGRSGTNFVSPTLQLSAKRHVAPSEAQSNKRARFVGMSAGPSKSSNPSNNSLPRTNISGKNLKKGKMKLAEGVTSVAQVSSNSQENMKVPHSCGDKRHACILEVVLDEESKAPETRILSSEATKVKPKIFHKEKLEATKSVTFVKRSSFCTKGKAESSSTLASKSPKVTSQNGIPQDKCPLMKSRSSKTSDLKMKGKLETGSLLQTKKIVRNEAYDDHKKGKDSRMVSKSPSLNNVRSNKSNTIVSVVPRAATSTSCSVSLNKLSYPKEVKTAKTTATNSEVLLAIASCPETMKKLGCGKESKALKRNKISYLHSIPASNFGVISVQDGEKRSSRKKHETEIVRSKVSSRTNSIPYESEILSEDCIIPKSNYIWRGQFLILRDHKLANHCAGVQAHLSSCASDKVLEVVDKLPQMITLLELPRMKMWPSQFVENHVREENIALYFFAESLDSYLTYYKRLLEHMTMNDLGLRGDFNGFELLIFTSKVLPEDCQRWNQLLYLWGVFRGRKVINSANIQITNSERQKNRDIEREKALDLNVYPPVEENLARDNASNKCLCIDYGVGGVPQYDNTGLAQADDKEEKRPESKAANLDLCLWPGLAMLSDGIAENEISPDIRGKSLMNDHDNDNLEKGEPSRSPTDVQNLGMLEAVEILISLSRGSKKI